MGLSAQEIAVQEIAGRMEAEDAAKAAADSAEPDEEKEDVAADEPADSESTDEDSGEDEVVTDEGDDKKEAGKDDDADEDSEDPAIAKLRLAAKLEDLPEETRPLVEKRLKDMEKHFTKTQQEATAWKQEAREIRSREVLFKTQPVESIAELLVENPDLEEKIAAELERRRELTPEDRKAEDTKLRERALKAVHDEDAAIEAIEQRGDEVETLASTLCKKANVPFGKAVQAMVANAIMASDTGDISNEDVKAIVKEYASEHTRSAIAHRREAKKEYVKDKVESADTVGIRPGKGKAVPPGTPQKEQTLEEKMTASANRIFAGQP